MLRQRVRVSYGPGDTEVVPATDVKPLFPPGNQAPREGGEPRPTAATNRAAARHRARNQVRRPSRTRTMIATPRSPRCAPSTPISTTNPMTMTTCPIRAATPSSTRLKTMIRAAIPTPKTDPSR